MLFETPLLLTGPLRSPAQMLAEQEYDGHTSVHDAEQAAALGLSGAPIEGPTHFSQFDPLATAVWGQAWFERGCISSHFRTMVVEGEQVQASLATTGANTARIEAHKADGTPVLVGTASLGPDHGTTELDGRRAAQGAPGELFVLDRLEVGMRIDEGLEVSMSHDERNGSSYPFSLAEKLDKITEPHPWYTAEGGPSSPWGRAIVPMEMLSVLTGKAGGRWPVRTPSLGLFLDLEVRLVDGPVFVGQRYVLGREVLGLSQSRRTESYWTRTTVTDADTDRLVAEVVLHSGIFKESYPGYPAQRLGTAQDPLDDLHPELRSRVLAASGNAEHRAVQALERDDGGRSFQVLALSGEQVVLMRLSLRPDGSVEEATETFVVADTTVVDHGGSPTIEVTRAGTRRSFPVAPALAQSLQSWLR